MKGVIPHHNAQQYFPIDIILKRLHPSPPVISASARLTLVTQSRFASLYSNVNDEEPRSVVMTALAGVHPPSWGDPRLNFSISPSLSVLE
jgi:hypothetical protein